MKLQSFTVTDSMKKYYLSHKNHPKWWESVQEKRKDQKKGLCKKTEPYNAPPLARYIGRYAAGAAGKSPNNSLTLWGKA